MRVSSAFVTLALALSPLTAGAQGSPNMQRPGAVPAGDAWTGSIDFGVRGTAMDGDGARYERYRDLGDGLFMERARAGRFRNGWLVDLSADHAGRRDQRYTANAERIGTFKSWFMWDQIPMLLSRETRTLYSGIGTGELRIADPLQAQVQAQRAALAGVFDEFGVQFDTRTRRHIGEGGFEYQPNRDLTLSANIRRTRREGTIPYGGSFGHSNPVEIPAPTNHDLTAADAGAEFVRNRLLLRAGFTGSWFQNDVTSVIFDNPTRATDIGSASSAGRLSLAPSNSFMGVNGLASVRLPHRSRVTAYLSVGALSDAGDPLMPKTINTAVVTAPLPRTTVDGEARTTAMNLNFVSRPTRHVDLSAGYRQYDFDNRTPVFTVSQRVAYDNAPSNLASPIHTEPFGILRQTFDADAKLSGAGVTGGIGFTRLGEERTFRIFESTTDNVMRLTLDAVGNRQYALRTKYEHARRRGVGIEEGEHLLAEINEQTGMRHFDIAARNRDRFTLLASVTPIDNVGVNVSVAAGKDDYLQSLFGLRDNTHRVYGVGFDASPGDRVVLGTTYSYERYNALSRSRQANPGPQFDDPSRNWATDATDRAHSVVMNADILRIAEKVDLRLTYDFSRARAVYEYITGPVADRTLPEEVIVATTLPTPRELPPTLSELQRGTMDLSYAVASHLSVGLAYWYEHYRVRDFTLDIDANPDLTSGALLLGYLYRPYTANTVWGRLIYRW